MHPNFNVFRAIFCLIIITALYACGEPTTRALPGSTGKAGEVVVVIDTKYWNGELGEYIKVNLAREQKALPQPEPIFNVVNIPTSSFKGLFITHRNLVIFIIGDDEPEGITEKKNIWATSQVVIKVSARSEKECLALLIADPLRLEEILIEKERNRLRQKFLSITNQELSKKLENKFDIRLNVPSDYVIYTDKDDFMWFSKETPEITQAIFVYTYEKSGNDLDNAVRILEMRDSITKENIPGPIEGSYMGTMHDFTAITRSLNFDGTMVTETRGLWNVVGDFMGGPYISLTLLSKDGSKVICVDGYVYAPKYDKRNYIRQVEAVLYSLEIAQ